MLMTKVSLKAAKSINKQREEGRDLLPHQETIQVLVTHNGESIVKPFAEIPIFAYHVDIYSICSRKGDFPRHILDCYQV